MTAIALNPKTQDYTVQNGALVRDASGGLLNACMLRVQIPLGSYWCDPTLGSKLYTLAQSKFKTNIQLLVKQYIQEALQPLIDDSRATAVDVVVGSIQSGWITAQVSVTATTGVRVTFETPVRVGQ